MILKRLKVLLIEFLISGKKKELNHQLTQGMYDAMVSMAYNMGPKCIRKSDSLFKRLKDGDMKLAKEINTYKQVVVYV